MEYDDILPNNWKGYLRISAFAVFGIAMGLSPSPWDGYLAAVGVSAGLTLLVTRWINRRDDPRHAKRPPDAP